MTINILKCWHIVEANDMNPPVETQKARYLGQYTNNNRVTPVFLYWFKGIWDATKYRI